MEMRDRVAATVVVQGELQVYLLFSYFFFFQAEDGIRDLVRSRGLGDVYKRQVLKAVVRAPMQPRLKRFMPFTTRQTAAKSSRFCRKAGVSGCTTWAVSYTHLTLPTNYSV